MDPSVAPLVRFQGMKSIFLFIPYTTLYEPGIIVVAPLPVFAQQIHSVPAPSKNSSANDFLDLYTNFRYSFNAKGYQCVDNY